MSFRPEICASTMPRPRELLRRADGSVRATLDERFEEFAVVKLGKDGKPAWTCVHGPQGAAQFLRSATATAPVPTPGTVWEDQVSMRAALRTLAAAALVAALAHSAHAAATITIINTDGAGEGFNDATPAAPVGGNAGLTIGQQRLNCFQQAANIWGATLTSTVTIQIRAAFNPLSCNATSAVLGSAGPRFVELNHPSLQFQNVWYHEALACKQAGVDLTPPRAPTTGSDINAQFNSNLGNVGCLTGSGWYYGFDHNEGALIDLLAVLLHEFGHGLGFSTVTSGSTGNYLNGPPVAPALWDRFLYDETTGLHWTRTRRHSVWRRRSTRTTSPGTARTSPPRSRPP
jgi:hypothetical protein